MENYTSQQEWDYYLDYLIEWVNSHSNINYYGMSPVCFDEFCNNELCEEED